MESAAFVKAAEVGNLQQVNEYLLRHAGNMPDFRPPLDFRVEAVHKAAENRHVSVVETIVRQCPNVLSHDVDQLGRTLLHIVARTGQEDMVELFAPRDRERMQVNAKAKGDITALHLAAYCGHVAVVELLCAWKGVTLAATSAEELNALHMASQQGHGEIVRVLIDACRTRSPNSLTALVNAQDCLGRTPLHYASAGGHVDVVKELLGVMEVDPSVPDKVMGLVPLHLAAWMGDHAEVVKMLTGVPAIDHNAQVAPDENAAIISAMSQLQNNDEVPELPRPKLKEAIHETSFTWKEENTWDQVYEIVLSIGGGTALHLACQQNHKAVVEALFQHSKVEANPVDNNGMTPIHYAAAEGHLEVLKVMVSESRVDLNPQVRAPGKYWHERAYRLDTPLHLAVLKGRLSAVKELCANPNLRPNKENWKRRTALHLAWITQHPNPEDIKDLLLARPEVRKYVDQMERGKSSLQNSANGLLVVGTLMAGLSFAATISPPAWISVDSMSPSPAPTPSLAAEDRLPSPLLSFWWFNHLTFFFSLVGFTAAVTCLLPSPFDSKKLFVAVEVLYLNRLVIVGTVMVIVAAFFASCAFLAAERANLGGTVPENSARLLGAVLLGVTYNTCWIGLLLPNLSRLVKSFWPDPFGLAADAAEMRACKNPSAKKRGIYCKTINKLITHVGFSAVCVWIFFKLYGA